MGGGDFILGGGGSNLKGSLMESALVPRSKSCKVGNEGTHLAAESHVFGDLLDLGFA